MKTIPASKCSTIAMVNGGEKTHPRVIHSGQLKEWCGIGWIQLRKATERDTMLYPTVT